MVNYRPLIIAVLAGNLWFFLIQSQEMGPILSLRTPAGRSAELRQKILGRVKENSPAWHYFLNQDFWGLQSFHNRGGAHKDLLLRFQNGGIWGEYKQGIVSRTHFKPENHFRRLTIGDKSYLLVNIGGRQMKEDQDFIAETYQEIGRPKWVELYRGGANKEAWTYLNSRREAVEQMVFDVYKRKHKELTPEMRRKMINFDLLNGNSDVLVLLETSVSDPRELSVPEFIRSAVKTISVYRTGRHHASFPRNADDFHPLDGALPVAYPYQSVTMADGGEIILEDYAPMNRVELARFVRFKGLSNPKHERALTGAMLQEALRLIEDPNDPVEKILMLQSIEPGSKATSLAQTYQFEDVVQEWKLDSGGVQRLYGMDLGDEAYQRFKALVNSWAESVIVGSE